MKFKQSIVALCSFTLLAGCATRPTDIPKHSWIKPDDHRYAGVQNFGKVNNYLWRGGQPNNTGFQKLESAGIKTVLNLRSDHDDLPLLRGTKLKYIRIPMRAWNPGQGDNAQLMLVLKTLQTLSRDPKTWPVFVHCAAGKDRTGYTVAAYRIVFENWSPNEAIEEMFDYRFNTVWFGNPDFLRHLSVNDVRAHLARAP